MPKHPGRLDNIRVGFIVIEPKGAIFCVGVGHDPPAPPTGIPILVPADPKDLAPQIKHPANFWDATHIDNRILLINRSPVYSILRLIKVDLNFRKLQPIVIAQIAHSIGCRVLHLVLPGYFSWLSPRLLLCPILAWDVFAAEEGVRLEGCGVGPCLEEVEEKSVVQGQEVGLAHVAAQENLVLFEPGCPVVCGRHYEHFGLFWGEVGRGRSPPDEQGVLEEDYAQAVVWVQDVDVWRERWIFGNYYLRIACRNIPVLSLVGYSLVELEELAQSKVQQKAKKNIPGLHWNGRDLISLNT